MIKTLRSLQKWSPANITHALFYETNADDKSYPLTIVPKQHKINIERGNYKGSVVTYQGLECVIIGFKRIITTSWNYIPQSTQVIITPIDGPLNIRSVHRKELELYDKSSAISSTDEQTTFNRLGPYKLTLVFDVLPEHKTSFKLSDIFDKDSGHPVIVCVRRLCEMFATKGLIVVPVCFISFVC